VGDAADPVSPGCIINIPCLGVPVGAPPEEPALGVGAAAGRSAGCIIDPLCPDEAAAELAVAPRAEAPPAAIRATAMPTKRTWVFMSFVLQMPPGYRVNA
jgi:hypothetical protein